MTLNLTFSPQTHIDFSPRITVIGVGGGGTNAVNTMIALDLKGVEFVVANTDAQSLQNSRADRRIQLGPHLTLGLGAGAKPEIGKAAAEEAADEVYRHLDGVHMVFITAGMGGGTGTGAAPVIARMARERGILTVGVVTKPFSFEGARRMKAAEQGIEDLQQWVDTLIVIPNQNLFRLSNQSTGFKEAFKMADNVLYMGVRGVTDLMVAPGLINLDFADIRTVMGEMGKAMMGTGEADGEGRAMRAAELAINNPLLEDTSMSGARGLLINITGGDDMTLFEVDQAANRIREEVDENANIIFGTATDENLTGRIRVSVVATGIENALALGIERPHLASVGGLNTAPAPIHVPPMHSQQQPAAVAAPMVQPMVVNASAVGYAPTMDTDYAAGAATARNLGSALAREPAPRMVPPAPRPFSPIQGGMSMPAPDMRGAEYRAPERQTDTRAEVEAVAIEEIPSAPRQIPAHLQQPLRPMQPSARPAQPRAAEQQRRPAPQPEQTVPARKSLFSIVTGAIRGQAAAHAPAPEPIEQAPVSRSEPHVTDYTSEPPRPASRPQVTDDIGVEIPAFLRRQT
ncbi:MAG: cell division protein FtsZ [Acetobacteraceae bacterium]|nr:cell division protein FtsZ [Acetobacteraceae bacterium]